MNASPLFELRDLIVRYKGVQGRVEVVSGVSLTVEQGTCLAIVGESGSGKSQSFLSALGLTSSVPEIHGAALFRGHDLLNLPKKDLNALRGDRIGFVFQNPHSFLAPHLRIESQMLEALRGRGAMNRSEQRLAARAALSSVRIEDPERVLQSFPFEISGGMAQRVMIAIAMINAPDLVIADEPTTALDASVRNSVLELLREAVDRRGAGLIIITHDIGAAAGLADAITVMYAGRVIETGPAASILASPAHPYTRGLIAAAPKLTGARQPRLQALPGGPPPAGLALDGCPFADRCPTVRTACRTTAPDLRPAGPGRLSACWIETAGIVS